MRKNSLQSSKKRQREAGGNEKNRKTYRETDRSRHKEGEKRSLRKDKQHRDGKQEERDRAKQRKNRKRLK